MLTTGDTLFGLCASGWFLFPSLGSTRFCTLHLSLGSWDRHVIKARQRESLSRWITLAVSLSLSLSLSTIVAVSKWPLLLSSSIFLLWPWTHVVARPPCGTTTGPKEAVEMMQSDQCRAHLDGSHWAGDTSVRQILGAIEYGALPWKLQLLSSLYRL